MSGMISFVHKIYERSFLILVFWKTITLLFSPKWNNFISTICKLTIIMPLELPVTNEGSKKWHSGTTLPHQRELLSRSCSESKWVKSGSNSCRGRAGRLCLRNGGLWGGKSRRGVWVLSSLSSGHPNLSDFADWQEGKVEMILCARTVCGGHSHLKLHFCE